MFVMVVYLSLFNDEKLQKNGTFQSKSYLTNSAVYMEWILHEIHCQHIVCDCYLLFIVTKIACSNKHQMVSLT